MWSRRLPVVTVLAAVLTAMVTSPSQAITSLDSTLLPGTRGSDVVNAVVSAIKSKCIFSEDRQFLRRLAYVETRDGVDTDTYRVGYNGGIWKVDEDMFNATRSCSTPIRHVCGLIRQHFNIDWTRVHWSDLRRPLYSALGAVLYLTLRTAHLHTSTTSVIIPATVQDQHDFWAHYYHAGNPSSSFSASVNAEDFKCDDEMDLVFVLDSSSSISDEDFELSLQFVAGVVTAMDVPHSIRVASVIYENLPVVKFYFNSFYDKSQVLSAIRGMTRLFGGTGTSLALNAVSDTVYTVAHGAHVGGVAKRVVVLVTDGQSNDFNKTATAAYRLRHDDGVAVVAIGVGGYNRQELEAVASEPVCDHVFTLTSFSDINNIVTEIRRSTCTAHRILTLNSTDVKGYVNTTLTSVAPSQNTSLKMEVTCGRLDIYTSYTNPNPNPAVYEEKYTASDGHPVYITSHSTDDDIIFVTLIGTRHEAGPDGVNNCTDYYYHISVTHSVMKLQCCFDEDCEPCTPSQLREYPGIRDVVCKNNENFSNPCTQQELDLGHTLFPYALDSSHFIRCDFKGQAYLTRCPNGVTFNPTMLTCGYEGSGQSLSTLVPDTYPNPCTPAHIQAAYYFFEYTPDRSKFVHCDRWGDAWLQSCPAFEVWDQSDLTCVPEHSPLLTTASPTTIVNPCTPEALAAGTYFFPYPCDHTRFIHCDITGNYWVQFCPAGMFYNPDIFVCVMGDVQHDPNHNCD